MEDPRPDPDALLALANAEAARAARGRLKIFFGFAPGVGKTYAMLEEARALRARGADVVAGVVETHRRAETEALLEGLEILPRREVPHRGILLREFDLDAALARRPEVVLVDELAHENAPGSRHAKRWQDAVELVESGIDVIGTLNVQHVESLSDVVAGIAGVVVRETVPDSLLERADELALVDIPPEELLERLREGKVYLPEQAERAARHFFRPGNLVALRELALRRTAERVAAQMIETRRAEGAGAVWHAADRLLVGVGPSPFSARLVRATKRMAETLHARWMAVSIETPDRAPTRDELERIAETLRLAESLGAETATIHAERAADGILRFARENNVTKIVAGKPLRRRLRDRLFGTIVDRIIRGCGDIDVYVISGDPELASARESPPRASGDAAGAGPDVLRASIAVAAATGLGAALHPWFGPTNVAMLFLLAVVAVSVRYGRRASILTTCLGVAAFDFLFVPPTWTFAVADSQYVLTFGVMMGVGLLVSELTARVRSHAERAWERERGTATLYDLSRALSATRGLEAIRELARREAGRPLGADALLLLPDAEGHIRHEPEDDAASPDRERGVAQWSFDHGSPAGRGTDTLAGAECLHLPLRAGGRTLGVLRLRPRGPDSIPSHERLRTIASVAGQFAQAVERETLARQARKAETRAETERTRNALLGAVSHDLRTPLTVIAGAAEVLEGDALDPDARKEFARSIREEATRLDRLVEDLLEMSRFESGGLRPRVEWHVLEEIATQAIRRLEPLLGSRRLTVCIPEDLPLVLVDSLLIERVIGNLLENAARHTPEGSPVELRARPEGRGIVVEIADRGPGLPAGETDRVFEPFRQSEGPATARTAADSPRDRTRGRGFGLGLAICKALVEAHGGRIGASPREGGGAVFSFFLPIPEEGPSRASAED